MLRNIANYKLFLIVLLTTSFGAACGFSTATTTPTRTADANARPASKPADPNRKKIVAFGDSLTIGLGLTEKESYPSLLQEKLDAAGFNYEIVNAGMSGDTSSGGLERIDWSLNQPNIEILILELGANDILRGQPIDQMKSNLREIIRKAKAKNITVLLCGMYAPLNLGGARGREINKAFESLAAEEKVAFLPFFLEGVGGIAKYNQADGIHPNAEGAKIIAETVHEAVTPLLKK